MDDGLDVLTSGSADDTREPSKTVLHVGCGPYNPNKLHATFRTPEWKEVRLDVDPNVQPDIVESITDMESVATTSVDAIFSSHNLEHLEAHQVPRALSEFQRVLKPNGFVLVTLPDLQMIAAMVAADLLEEPAYTSPAGPISPVDMIYGHRASLQQGHTFMAHRTGFTAKSLHEALMRAGFRRVTVKRKPKSYELWAVGYKDGPA